MGQVELSNIEGSGATTVGDEVGVLEAQKRAELAHSRAYEPATWACRGATGRSNGDEALQMERQRRYLGGGR